MSECNFIKCYGCRWYKGDASICTHTHPNPYDVCYEPDDLSSITTTNYGVTESDNDKLNPKQ